MKTEAMLLAAALTIAVPVVAAERTGTEMLFDQTALSDVDPGTVLRYSHTRSADENIPFKPLLDQTFVLSVVDGTRGQTTQVRRFSGKSASGSQEFPISSGNPVPPIFLTSAVSAVAFATKGSGFYIKNRFQNALYSGGEVSNIEIELDGETIEATEIVYRPFEGDPNVAKMGRAFAALEMKVVLSEAVPGDIVTIATRSEVDGVEYFVEEIAFLDASKE